MSHPTQNPLAAAPATSEPGWPNLAPSPRYTADRNVDEHRGLIQQNDGRPSIIDDYADVLLALPPRRRRGLIAQLAVGFYEGWRPGRAEVIDLVAVELRILTIDECERRRRYRNNGYPIPEINVLAKAHRLHVPSPVLPATLTRQRDRRGHWATKNPPTSVPGPPGVHQEERS